ncbi:TonB-dependent receptor domain-containing protein [Novosphingobium pokkalii]|uniref:TonB-dependent receptor domain-containing protein n=1 Tax=Novosphingobium pokkalii TaxID=1770194 RepID=A0ABV7V4K6_9SPHN|nr:TonB-dependent receptor [Novosphingobium pokkalii]GHC92458.1 TonB-dependent receptor [Novosphingobium pokkalii]
MKAPNLVAGCAILALALASAAHAAPAGAAAESVAPEAAEPAPSEAAAATGAEPARKVEVFSTGVAKGRDRLDSAISTSALRGEDIVRFGPRSAGDVLRTLPGLRVESGIGEGNNNYTVRGLPLAAGGSKYMQIQEDGLPLLEFGDLFNAGSDVYLRNDFNVAAIEVIRGGSASTFASDSPGGLINFMSKTGDNPGGAVQVSSGLNYDEKRVDFDYGARLSDNLRFHLGGFYRSGEGPRRIGMTGWRGGQVKFNITRSFANGYIRLYAKLLDDRSPTYAPYPVAISGTNDNPVYTNLPNFDIRRDSVLSPYLGPVVTLDSANQPAAYPLATGQHAVSKALGLEAEFEVGGFTISDKLRYASNSGDFDRAFNSSINTVSAFAAAHGGAGATAAYATGPRAGQAIDASVNGNGLLALYYVSYLQVRSLDNFTNDLRATRVWKVGGGNLTTTLGVYAASQALDTTWLHTAMDIDVAGRGQTAMVNVFNSAGVAQTLNGYYAFGRGRSGQFRRLFDVTYGVLAPYGSINYHIGKLAIGGSVRFDSGRVRGSLYGADLGGGRLGVTSYDMNRDGQITGPEAAVAMLPLTQPAPVNYNYSYVSYSTGVNYRVAEPFSVFARYSRGGRANADKILFTPLVDTASGAVTDPRGKYDAVRQLEGGFKFRKGGITLNVTGFTADADDHNVLNGSANRTDRTYHASGVEVEGGVERGVFRLAYGATYTKARITIDRLDPTLTGKEPRHQPTWTFSATPEVDLGKVAAGASLVTITSSYAQDSNLLKMPGFTTVNVFAQVRPAKGVYLTFNVNNLFDAMGIFEVAQSTVPASGLGFARSITGRTLSTSLGFNF